MSLVTETNARVNEIQGDEEYDDGLVYHQQWVTLTASMWPKPTSAPPGGWRGISTDRLPLLVAVFCGAVLVICLVCAVILYRCCIMPKKEKHYSMRKSEGTNTPHPPTAIQQPQRVTAHLYPQYPVNQQPQIVSISCPNYRPQQSAVYAEQKGSQCWGYSNRLVSTSSENQWFQYPRQCTQCPGVCPGVPTVPRSSSVPGSSEQKTSINRKQRPASQPIEELVVAKQTPMPEISEFSPHHHAQYASSSILDEVGSKDNDGSPSTTLKTRSLPAWVRNKPRPLSTEDDLNDLYAKVNFSKKRKNRMRNDEAAIIALSKSRSQFLHKDTDSLVDNEAVIVYDERTAL